MLFIQGNHEIQAFPPDRADYSFAICIHSRRPHRSFQNIQTHRLDSCFQLSRTFAVPVMDRIALPFIFPDDFAKLLAVERLNALPLPRAAMKRPPMGTAMPIVKQSPTDLNDFQPLQR
jgi:hypothetical protein